MTTPKFANTAPSFHVELKKRINQYFTTTGKEVTGNAGLYWKAIILSAVFILLYVHLVFFTPPVFFAIVECFLFGAVGAALCFNMMHDGSHGSFSKNKAVNYVVSHAWDLMGGSTFIWKMKHNVIHHSYTNVDGIDDDIDVKPWLRMSDTQKRFWMHRFQHLYFWFLYPMTYVFMIAVQDFLKYFRGKIGDIPMKKMSVTDHVEFWGYKVVFALLFVILPIYTVGIESYLVGFLIYSLVFGFILSIVFQLAHTVEHTEFPLPDINTNRFEDEWAVHQIKTTANFATKSRLISWYVGGLNFQIEHHLFPKISHIHYPAISKIIKQACQEHGLAYVEYPRMHNAVASHVSFLRDMGRGI